MNNVSMMCTLPSADADWQTAPRQLVTNASQLLAALAAEAAEKQRGVGVLVITSDMALEPSSIQGASLPFNVSRGRTLVLAGGECSQGLARDKRGRLLQAYLRSGMHAASPGSRAVWL